jgi:hypothetical protein
MKRILPFLILAFLAPLLVMCRPAYNGPVSRICRYEGAQRGESVILRCTGIGGDHSAAVVDAQKAGSWYVASRILKSAEDRERFGSIERSFYNRFNSFFNNVRPNSRMDMDDEGRYRVNVKLDVNRNEIVKFLKDYGVIKDIAPGQEVGKPSIGVVIRWKVKTRDPAWNELARNSATEFLTERGYNAIDTSSGIRKMNELEQRVVKSQNLPMDEEYRASLMMGADIMIEVTVWNKSTGRSTKGAAAVKAYETTTKRLVGSSSAFGEEYPLSVNQSEFKTMKEAIQGAVERVLDQLNGYWKQDAPSGSRYYVIVAGDLSTNPDLADLISVRLKKLRGIKEFNRTTATATRLTFQFQTQMDNTETSLALKQVLRNTPGIKSLTTPISSRKFFFFTVNHKGQQTAKPNDPDSLPPGI